MHYGISKSTEYPFEEALRRTKEALAKEGFGALTEIDVRSTMKKKLDVEFDNYVILGACNPPLAHQALLSEREIGLLLPCNVIVYEDEGKTHVSAIRPSVAMSMVENPKLAEIAKTVEQKLETVIGSI